MPQTYDDDAVVERYLQAQAAQNANLHQDAERLYAHVLKQFADLPGPASFEAEASVAGSFFALGKLALYDDRSADAKRYFTNSAKAYEELATRPEANLMDRAAMAQNRAAEARAAAEELTRLDASNLPPATEVLGDPFYHESATWGGYFVSTLNNVITVQEPTLHPGNVPLHQTAISEVPIGSWTTLKKRTGEPLPVHVLWNGAELTVRFGGPIPT
jgi:hypothetical protein